jgi:hypothetical protein
MKSEIKRLPIKSYFIFISLIIFLGKLAYRLFFPFIIEFIGIGIEGMLGIPPMGRKG